MEEKEKKNVKSKKRVSHKSHKKTKQKSKTIKLALLLMAIVVCLILIDKVVRVDTVNIVGNEVFTADEIKKDLFSGKETKSLASILIQKLMGQEKKIIYLSNYYISIDSLHTITVTVQEKEPFGCIDYGGMYVYIDIDGMILDLDKEKREDVPILEGIYITKAILYEPIETKDLSKLKHLQKLKSLVQKHDLSVDVMYCSAKETFRLTVGTIQVFLGDMSNLEEKVNKLVSIYPKMEGLSGTLYLNEYNDQNNVTRFEVSQ